MGRLIDEDVLLKNLEWLKDYDHYVLYDVEMSIDKTPTVKAIPVEWLKEWFNTKMNSTLLPRNFEMVCGWMIYDWEKENEKQTMG